MPNLMKSATFAFGLAVPLVAVSAATVDGDVDQKGLRFTKPVVTISHDGTMRFHNSDDVKHNIMTIDESDMPSDHGLQRPGETISAKFDKPGVYQVRCAIHPKMKMTVKVDE